MLSGTILHVYTNICIHVHQYVCAHRGIVGSHYIHHTSPNLRWLLPHYPHCASELISFSQKRGPELSAPTISATLKMIRHHVNVWDLLVVSTVATWRISTFNGEPLAWNDTREYQHDVLIAHIRSKYLKNIRVEILLMPKIYSVSSYTSLMKGIFGPLWLS